jgi:hypothetical protein
MAGHHFRARLDQIGAKKQLAVAKGILALIATFGYH